MNLKLLKLFLVLLFTFIIRFTANLFSFENTYTNNTLELILSLIAAILLTNMLTDENH